MDLGKARREIFHVPSDNCVSLSLHLLHRSFAIVGIEEDRQDRRPEILTLTGLALLLLLVSVKGVKTSCSISNEAQQGENKKGERRAGKAENGRFSNLHFFSLSLGNLLPQWPHHEMIHSPFR